MSYVPPTAEIREDFHQGRNYRAYEMFGAHLVEENGEKKWHFSVWAPNARAVSVVGEFCSWNVNAYPMRKIFDGTWELRIPAEKFKPESDPERYSYKDADVKLKAYKFAVQNQDGSWHEKADPYGFAMQKRPDTASMLKEFEPYLWHDEEWIEKRKSVDMYTQPMNIYEVHLGSWKRKGSTKSGDGASGSESGTAGEVMNYSEIADELIPYVKEMGYTHIELLPVMEHPLDMSWGYQVSGYFAATSRYGTLEQFKEFMDRCHQSGIGVILDWVPAHFPKDEMGLRRFDGTCCYEHQDSRRGEMPTWGTCMFDMARGEVRSFLMSSACYFIENFHADGIRVDAVSAIVYHDFCREGGNWLPNRFGGRENLEGIAFLQRLNTMVRKNYPGVMMIAEESHAYPGVTAQPAISEKDGMPLPVFQNDGKLVNTNLGFTFKWNMGWMNDMLSYVKLDPIYRKWHHDKLTFSLFYAFSEHFVLPFSHDEVVHGKQSMLDKQPGDIWKKFAGLRALYGYTMAHPGKKLLFMGGEFGQFIEWKFDDQLDWFLLLYDKHPQLQKCVKDLNRLYTSFPCLYEIDNDWSGFKWIQANDNANSLTAFIRTDTKDESLVCVTNFTPQYIPQYRIGLPKNGTITEVLNTDDAKYGGSDKKNTGAVRAKKQKWNEFDYSCDIAVPPLATVFFRYKKTKPRKKTEENAEKLAEIRKPSAKKTKVPGNLAVKSKRNSKPKETTLAAE